MFDRAEDLSGGTIARKCSCLQILGEFLTSENEHELNPRTFQVFLRWLGSATDDSRANRFNENSIIGLAVTIIEMYAYGLQNNYPGFSQRDFDTMLVARRNVLRGFRRRATQISIDKALSKETYLNFLKAVTLEFEQCRGVLEQRSSGKRLSLYNDGMSGGLRLDPNPYVVFAALCGLRHGVRSQEFNAIRRADLCVDMENGQHELYLHASGKPDAYIPVDDAFVEAWSLCEEWDREARAFARDGEIGFDDSGFVYSSTSMRQYKAVTLLHTERLNRHFLPYFYRKWFKHDVQDKGGKTRPLLHAENDISIPLWCPYSKLRNAFAVHFAERERNRHITKEVLRHANVSTSERFYLNNTKLDHAKKVYYALKPEAQMLVMGLKNPVEAGISVETLEKAKAAGALLPHGICGAAINGNSCVRASGCLGCPYLVVIANRKPRFEAGREHYLKKADVLQAKGDFRGAENALSQAKLCQAHIIRINDTFGMVTTE
jgi:hypothetical protein